MNKVGSKEVEYLNKAIICSAWTPETIHCDSENCHLAGKIELLRAPHALATNLSSTPEVGPLECTLSVKTTAAMGHNSQLQYRQDESSSNRISSTATPSTPSQITFSHPSITILVAFAAELIKPLPL